MFEDKVEPLHDLVLLNEELHLVELYLVGEHAHYQNLNQHGVPVEGFVSFRVKINHRPEVEDRRCVDDQRSDPLEGCEEEGENCHKVNDEQAADGVECIHLLVQRVEHCEWRDISIGSVLENTVEAHKANIDQNLEESENCLRNNGLEVVILENAPAQVREAREDADDSEELHVFSGNVDLIFTIRFPR